MDTNTPAWKLAQAANDSVNRRADALDEALAELRPSARVIAKAYEISLTSPQFSGAAAPRIILDAHLRVALVEEQVAAQERMGRRLERLTWALVGLTLALALFGAADFSHRWEFRWPW